MHLQSSVSPVRNHGAGPGARAKGAPAAAARAAPTAGAVPPGMPPAAMGGARMRIPRAGTVPALDAFRVPCSTPGSRTYGRLSWGTSLFEVCDAATQRVDA